MADDTYVDWDCFGAMPEEPETLTKTTVVENQNWVAGIGDKNADIMVIGASPGWNAAKYQDPFAGKGGDILKEALREAGIDTTYTLYLTNAVKYNSADIKKRDYKRCLRVLLNEIQMVKPKVIITLGADTFPVITGKDNLKLSEHRGTVVTCRALPNTQIIPTWNPGYVARQPDMWGRFLEDVTKAKDLLDGKEVKSGGKVDPYELIDSTAKLNSFLASLYNRAQVETNSKSIMIAVDAEWEGERAMDLTTGYMRTLQFTSGTVTGVMKFYPCSRDDMFKKKKLDDEGNWCEKDGVGLYEYDPIDPDVVYPGCVDIKQSMDTIKKFFEFMDVGIIGQNVKADGMWFYRYGIDIRDYVKYDTMLVEHLISNIGQFSLEELTMKYTTMGRYDVKLIKWKRLNKGLTNEGYGAIPDSILLPYAAGDTQATWKIFKAQMQYIRANRPALLAKRGIEKQYPSLIQATVRMQQHLYEFELVGLPIDLVLLKKLTKIYNDKRRQLLAQVVTTAANFGFEDFNPNSPQQVQNLLYSEKGLKLVPIRSTGQGSKAKPWEWVMRQREDLRKKYNPSADGKSLEILSKVHDFPKMLLHYSRINKMCTGFLREDEAGGLTGMIGTDGHIHPEFGQLTDTGRLTSRKPNVQNWSKVAEIKMWEIFGGKAHAPVSIRTAILAPEGCKIIEADYKQAELFVLSGLSGDKTMMEALTTPGKDLHDITTISSFNVKTFDAEGNEVDTMNDPEVLKMASEDPEAHDKFMGGVTYKMPDGKTLSRGEFKKGLRTAGKAVNFGISYGRGAAAISGQIEVETGVKIPEATVQQAIDGWKSEFKVAWAFIETNQQRAADPGFVENAWGRRRYFEKKDQRSEQAASGREAGNFPIQSTVADCMALAAEELDKARKERGLGFKIINQIHDAFIFIVPTAELELTSKIIVECMAVEIPLYSGQPLKLGVDVDVYDRWCA